MMYEKKMLILSGEGKGVVLIEKSALGLRFSLTTFDMPTCGVLKAGVITPSAVFIRDLPQCDNPSAVFMLDADSADKLHFAVFDAKLRLYGTNARPMWEANVMDLFSKIERKAEQPELPKVSVLPPIATPPGELPMPDGTGIPQSRIAIYGDEAIAESNFYTDLDITPHLSRVDKFLDEPRLLDGLAPMVVAGPADETTAIIDEASDEQSDEVIEQQDYEEAFMPDSDNFDKAEKDEGDAGALPPWQMQAMWLKSRSSRELQSQTLAVKPMQQAAATVKPLREISFTERAAADIQMLFSNADKDEKLNALLPDIEWVRVPVDGHVISVGKGEGFLCYAVSGTYKKTSPLGEEAQWLPENKSLPTGKGYWLIFQSLKDGKIIAN